MTADESAVLVEGPWRHRDVTASGLRFHVAEHGPSDGPLVLLLHGFPEFWWSWRHQLVALGEAGFHAVAPDLRGYGATDKPPRGYDGYTLAADVAGLVRALGAESAHVVGHDWGAAVAWGAATLHPRSVNRLSVLSIPHPNRMRDVFFTDPHQLRMSSYMAFFQTPKVPENRLTAGDLVSDLLTRWGGPSFPDSETEQRCREAMTIPGAAHCALEYYRWAFRSLLRPSGQRYGRLMGAGVHQPVLHLHGSVDGCIRTESVHGTGAFAHGGYALKVLDGLGHFPHQEDPELITELLLEHARP
ncbi:MAG: Soluble epoxide hydrolase [Frankiales bacterium]|nr:Soluble epoxide hydrolase [Frankiales bacterium]